MSELELEFDDRPSVVAYMARAMYPGFLRKAPPFPRLRVRWRRMRPDPVRLGRFLELTGLDASGGLPLLYPQVVTFPLQMVILTHPSLPLPIWKVLQVRNALLRHRPVPLDATLDVEAAIVGQRVLEKAMELDLHVEARLDQTLAWEGLTTYAYRGRFGPPASAASPAGSRLAAPAGSQPATPVESGAEVARWRTESGGGLRFTGISGDTNGIHYWNAYARLFGFDGAIHHPHALVGRCLARLPVTARAAQRLDLWLKGPVYYGSEVGLAARGDGADVAFSLTVEGSSRPAIVGRRSEVAPGYRLLDGRGLVAR